MLDAKIVGNYIGRMEDGRYVWCEPGRDIFVMEDGEWVLGAEAKQGDITFGDLNEAVHLTPAELKKFCAEHEAPEGGEIEAEADTEDDVADEDEE